MLLKDYLVETKIPGEAIIEDWRWLLGPDLQLWHVTKSGNALLRHSTNGTVHFLDVAAGSVEQIAADVAGFKAAVVIRENLQQWLMPTLVDQLTALGVSLSVNECFSFRKPPLLGGKISADNLAPCDIEVHFSISGQIYQQIKNLPPGTKIGKIKLVGG